MDIIKGIFINECKGRFYCEVEISGKIEKCYVASSAKLHNFIDLNNQKVYLLKNFKCTKTKYALFALEKDKNNVILLNLNRVNKILIRYLLTKGFKTELFKNEVKLHNGYKADVIYNNSPMIIFEIKTILSKDNRAVYPNLQTKRVKAQLEKIIIMLKEGYQFEYVFFLLEPNIINVEINYKENELRNLFAEAFSLNMKIRVYKTLWNGTDFYIEEDEKIKNEFVRSIIQ